MEYNLFNEKNLKGTSNELNMDLSSISPDYNFLAAEKGAGVAISGYGTKLSFWQYKAKKHPEKGIYIVTYDMSEILELSIKVDEVEQHLIQSDGAIGRAIVGGILLGGAGAVVGAASADKKQKMVRNTNKLSIEFLIDDYNKPLREIFFYIVTNADEQGEKERKLRDAEHTMEFLTLLYELSALGVKYHAGLELNVLKNSMRLYRSKSKNVESDERRKDLLNQFSSSLKKHQKALPPGKQGRELTKRDWGYWKDNY